MHSMNKCIYESLYCFVKSERASRELVESILTCTMNPDHGQEEPSLLSRARLLTSVHRDRSLATYLCHGLGY